MVQVSSTDQKPDLDRQVARLTQWATGNKLAVTRVVSEVGSALSGARPKLTRLLADPEVSVIVVEHRDRLARFGVEYIEAALCRAGPYRARGGRAGPEVRDFLHKTTTRLARTKSAIAVETLHVRGMVTNRRLARAISDAGFGEFVRQLDYRTAWYGSRLWRADRWFPSSKTCGNPCCGRVNRALVLADRVWRCSACGTVHDRDGNAAGNLLAAMLADTA